MRLCQFLMQDESFPISHAGWDFLVFSLKMRFSHILIQDETFPISHAGWDFWVFLCYMRLFVRRMKQKQKKNHFTKTASLRARGQKHNGKPLHDRERLVRQSLENISKASLDVSGCPSLGIFGGLWRSLGVFGGLWGSLRVFRDLWGLFSSHAR